MTTLAKLLIVVLSIAALSLGACRTTKGFGEDLEKLGENIKDAAE